MNDKVTASTALELIRLYVKGDLNRAGFEDFQQPMSQIFLRIETQKEVRERLVDVGTTVMKQDVEFEIQVGSSAHRRVEPSLYTNPASVPVSFSD